jgi:hypothetical protein
VSQHAYPHRMLSLACMVSLAAQERPSRRRAAGAAAQLPAARLSDKAASLRRNRPPAPIDCYRLQHCEFNPRCTALHGLQVCAGLCHDLQRRVSLRVCCMRRGCDTTYRGIPMHCDTLPGNRLTACCAVCIAGLGPFRDRCSQRKPTTNHARVRSHTHTRARARACTHAHMHARPRLPVPSRRGLCASHRGTVYRM